MSLNTSIRILLAIFTAMGSSTLMSQDIIFKASEGQIRFESDAPLELIAAYSSALQGVLELKSGAFAFIVANKSFQGFNSPIQQEHFYENYIEADRYPRSSFRGKIIEPLDTGMRGEFDVRTKGILNIHGVEQERIIRSKLTITENGITIRSFFIVPLQDHNIEIPRVVYQKIAEEIEVEVSIDLIPETRMP